MTYPENNKPNAFPAQYELPSDQLSAEMTLRETFAAQFPDYAELLASNLSDLQREAGIAIPKYRVSEENMEETQALGLSDELGFAAFGSEPLSAAGYRKLFVELPSVNRVTPEEYSALSPIEKRVVEQTQDGTNAVDMPSHTAALVDGMYALTGASVLRDQREESMVRGTVVRQGTYMGKTVYFCEHFNDQSQLEGMTLFSLSLVGEEFARKEVNGLNPGQFREFAHESGIGVGNLLQFIDEMGVTKDNYKAVLGVLKATHQEIELARPTDEENE